MKKKNPKKIYIKIRMYIVYNFLLVMDQKQILISKLLRNLSFYSFISKSKFFSQTHNQQKYVYFEQWNDIFTISSISFHSPYYLPSWFILHFTTCIFSSLFFASLLFPLYFYSIASFRFIYVFLSCVSYFIVFIDFITATLFSPFLNLYSIFFKHWFFSVYFISLIWTKLICKY